jgi:hypoxanthine phosphoribosyltransferase
MSIDLFQDTTITPLITEEQIKTRVAELGTEVSKFYAKWNIEKVVVVCVLKGAFIFCADLMRSLTIPDPKVEFMAISSYLGGCTETSGIVELKLDLQRSVFGQHILIVEDIADTRLTLAYIIKLLKGRDPASIKVCALLDKPSRQIANIPVDHIGFEIEDKFVVGYGLDHRQRYRQLPYIGVLNS